jgi:ligand-binding SRPBCC domain-containing protein
MMKIKIKTPIKGKMEDVYKRFDEKLFRFLTPSEKQMRVLHFGGSKKGDLIKLEFVWPVKGFWTCEITEVYESPMECYFTDEGALLPFGLKKWKHVHRVVKAGENCIIVDDITFTTGNLLLDLIYYPVFFLGFYPRKILYRKFFRS